jgi:hypothetical protein
MRRLPRTKLSGRIVSLTSQLTGPLPMMGELSTPPRRRLTSLMMSHQKIQRIIQSGKRANLMNQPR